jgi:hypothetical protein
MVAFVLVTEPVTDDRLDPLRRQNQQDCGTKHNYFITRATGPHRHEAKDFVVEFYLHDPL